MTFMSDQLAAAKAAIANGDPERSAEITIHTMLEGPGSLAENLEDLAEADTE